MTERETLFRQEALDAWTRGRDRSGGVVQLTSAWRIWLYRATLLLVVGGVLSLWLVRTEERASGPAVVDERTGAVTVLLPATAVPYLTSSGLRVELPRSGRGPVPVVVRQARQASDAETRAAGLQPIAQPGILLSGQLHDLSDGSPGSVSPVPATASVVIRSERLVDLLARRFGGMLGSRQAQP